MERCERAEEDEMNRVPKKVLYRIAIATSVVIALLGM